jgi:signal transduction histidine kinase
MFGRMRAWSRRHAVAVDAAGVAPFLLLYVLGLPGYVGADPSGGLPVPAHAVATPALLLPLVLRRRYPLGAFAAVTAAALLKTAAGAGLIWADLAVVVAMSTVAAHCRMRWALTALGTVAAGLALTMARSPYADWSDWGAFASYTFLVLLCWVTGLYAKARRDHLDGLEERAASLEREREARAQAAIAEERTRIAHEMHDVVAHNLSVMVVQADGAAYAIDTDPARARTALETISETGRAALAEVRGILGVLRDGPHEGFAPRPGVEQVGGLVERVRGAGLPVELTTVGTPRPVPAGVGLAAYRVVQEALTNTLKHTGPQEGVRARVWLRYGSDALEVRVVDDGRGAAARAPKAPGAGQGLIGMRERVSAYGGRVRAGPRTGGGYEVVASLPLRPVAG